MFDLQIEEIHSQISGRSQHLLFLSAVVSYLVSVTVLTSSVLLFLLVFCSRNDSCSKQRKLPKTTKMSVMSARDLFSFTLSMNDSNISSLSRRLYLKLQEKAKRH